MFRPLRALAQSPAFAAAAILTLALGIGANTAIFTVANALLLRPLPYREPGRLVQVTGEKFEMSWPRTQMLIERSRSFDGIAAYAHEVFNVTGRGDPEQVPAARVSWNFFDVLGIRPAEGRGFLPAEDQPSGDLVAIVSHGFHERHPEATLTLDGKSYTVAGMLPPDFRFVALAPEPDIYTPRVYDFNLMTRAQIQSGVGFLDCVARLAPGVSIATAQAEMAPIEAQYRAANPGLPDAQRAPDLRVRDLRAATVANIRPTLLILFGAVALVLVIACANVASLLLARALSRRREIAVRAALGATRATIVRQLLAEAAMLALLGGVCGAALSAWGTRALTRLGQTTLPRASEIRPDGYVFLFALAASVAAAALFGLAPAIQLSRTDLNTVLRAEGRGSTGGRRRNVLRNLLIVGQVALSMVLIAGAGLLLRNFLQLRAGAPGFDPHGVLTMNIALPPARYATGTQMISFYDRMLESARALPGVQGASLSSALPSNRIRLSPALPEGQPEVRLMQRPWFTVQTLTPDYARTLRVPLVHGREFNRHDEIAAPPVVMINRTAARRFWPGGNPVGRHILVGRQPKAAEIVGVLGDVRNNGLAADVEPEIYLPFAQLPWAAMNLELRASGDPRALAAAARARVLALDRDLPVTNVRTLDEVLESAAAQPRFATTLLGALAVLALVLAVVGIYGAVAYAVAERTNELGVRIALGASRGAILAMVLRQGLALAGAGIALGLAAALALTRLMTGMLYHVSTTDPATLIAGAVFFAAAAALASYAPARRATRVDPLEALR